MFRENYLVPLKNKKKHLIFRQKSLHVLEWVQAHISIPFYDICYMFASNMNIL